jgi:hypothetical protein
MMLQQSDGVFLASTSARVYSRVVEPLLEVVAAGVGDGVGVGVGVGVTTGVGVGVTTGVGDGVGVGVGVTTGVGVGVGETVGCAGVLTTTPRFQTRFLPFFTHVNSRPLKVSFAPNFLQVAPALGVTARAGARFINRNEERTARATTFRIRRLYCDATFFAPLDLFEDKERL